ncbi:MAG TPA: tetratricopeptide repeat protein [Saprospiraceae bacterium]|nr:tetratricopeptide repeat protein [Saprospiraceae bacterium]
MELSLADQYFLKAMDWYPWNLEFVTENLQYALSYDDEHSHAWCLMGMLYMYQFKNFESAKPCFEKALQHNHRNSEIYEHFILLNIWNANYDHAKKLIDFAIKIKGVDHCKLHRLHSKIEESEGKYKAATQLLKQATVVATSESCIAIIEQDIKRIKTKDKVLSSMLRKNKKETKKNLKKGIKKKK